MKYASIAITALILLQIGCSGISTGLVRKADRIALRNPDTGILIGAEERDLGDPDSSNAALFVHGFVGAGNNFADLPERVADLGWRVRVLRLPGHGTSPLDFEDVPPQEPIDCVLHEIAALREKHETVVPIGHSMGCALSVIAAGRVKVDGLILGAPYFGITHKWYYILPPETWLKIGRPFLRWVYKGQYFIQVNRKEAKKEIVSYPWVPVRGIATLVELGKMARSPETLEKIDCPVLILHGTSDTAASPKMAEKIFNSLPSKQKRFVWLENSDHHIYWDYDREEVFTEILKQLTALEYHPEN